MKITKVLSVIALATLLVACNKPAGELVGVRNGAKFKEANPYGMVFIRKGSFMMGANTQSAIFEQQDNVYMATVEAFWMDETVPWVSSCLSVSLSRTVLCWWIIST